MSSNLRGEDEFFLRCLCTRASLQLSTIIANSTTIAILPKPCSPTLKSDIEVQYSFEMIYFNRKLLQALISALTC